MGNHKSKPIKKSEIVIRTKAESSLDCSTVDRVFHVLSLILSRRALAKWHSLCVFVNRWALAPGPNSLNTKTEDSDKGFKVSAIGR